MITTPLNDLYVLDRFLITTAIIEKGYHILSKIPEVKSVRLTIGNYTQVITPQYSIVQVDEDLQVLFPDVDLYDYVISWSYNELSTSSSSSECFIPDPLWMLIGTLYDILYLNINEYAHIRYVSQ